MYACHISHVTLYIHVCVYMHMYLAIKDFDEPKLNT